MGDEEKKPEVQKIVVEAKGSNTTIVILTTIVVLMGAVMMLGEEGIGGILSDDDDFGAGNCGDGLDNDNGGQADKDDPDCYHTPEAWKGYDPNLSESISSNDPINGRPN